MLHCANSRYPVLRTVPIVTRNVSEDRIGISPRSRFLKLRIRIVPKGRQEIARGVSPGEETRCEIKPRRGERNRDVRSLSPLRGLGRDMARFPRAYARAITLRRSAARVRNFNTYASGYHLFPSQFSFRQTVPLPHLAATCELTAFQLKSRLCVSLAPCPPR